MRLDKFLKVSRLVKRRTLAKQVCDQGRVQINGRIAKASTDVSPGDRLLISIGRRHLEIKVVAVSETVRAADAEKLYEVVAEEYREIPEDDLLV